MNAVNHECKYMQDNKWNADWKIYKENGKWIAEVPGQEAETETYILYCPFCGEKLPI